jgi:hypothetical protein
MANKTLEDYRAIARELYGPDSHAVKCLNIRIGQQGNIAPSTPEEQMMNLLAKWDAKTGVEFEKPEPAAPKENAAGALLRGLGSKQ